MFELIVEVNTTPITKLEDYRVRCTYHSSTIRSLTRPHVLPYADIRYAQRTLQLTLDLEVLPIVAGVFNY